MDSPVDGRASITDDDDDNDDFALLDEVVPTVEVVAVAVPAVAFNVLPKG